MLGSGRRLGLRVIAAEDSGLYSSTKAREIVSFTSNRTLPRQVRFDHGFFRCVQSERRRIPWLESRRMEIFFGRRGSISQAWWPNLARDQLRQRETLLSGGSPRLFIEARCAR